MKAERERDASSKLSARISVHDEQETKRRCGGESESRGCVQGDLIMTRNGFTPQHDMTPTATGRNEAIQKSVAFDCQLVQSTVERYHVKCSSPRKVQSPCAVLIARRFRSPRTPNGGSLHELISKLGKQESTL